MLPSDVPLDNHCQASFSTAVLAVGTHLITASYGGAPDFAGSTSTFTVQVTYAIHLPYGPEQAHQAGSTIPIKLQLKDAAGNNLYSSTKRVSALGIASATAPNTILPAKSAGNANPDGKFKFMEGTYQFNLKTDGLASGVYYFYFLVDGDPVRHAVQFVIR